MSNFFSTANRGFINGFQSRAWLLHVCREVLITEIAVAGMAKSCLPLAISRIAPATGRHQFWPGGGCAFCPSSFVLERKSARLRCFFTAACFENAWRIPKMGIVPNLKMQPNVAAHHCFLRPVCL